MRIKKSAITKAITILAGGGVGVMPTDTIYGIVGTALDPEAVARIFQLRHRDLKKPPITLISSFEDLKLFGIRLDAKTRAILQKFWPGKVSVVLKMPRGAGTATLCKKFSHLHRGTNTLSFRMPKSLWLRKLLSETGPLIAPSANLQGEPTAKTIRAAKKYFDGGVDFYLDGGDAGSVPSTLIKLEKRKITVLREGAVRFDILKG